MANADTTFANQHKNSSFGLEADESRAKSRLDVLTPAKGSGRHVVNAYTTFAGLLQGLSEGMAPGIIRGTFAVGGPAVGSESM